MQSCASANHLSALSHAHLAHTAHAAHSRTHPDITWCRASFQGVALLRSRVRARREVAGPAALANMGRPEEEKLAMDVFAWFLNVSTRCGAAMGCETGREAKRPAAMRSDRRGIRNSS
jgi:hypothetical protein